MKGLGGILILLAMALGVGAGFYVHDYMPADQAKMAITTFGLITKIFLMMIKMIIAPLVLFTLIAGIGHMEDTAAIGRVGLKSILWFLAASVVSLVIGMYMVEWLQPGVGLNLDVGAGAAKVPSTEGFTIEKFIEHLFPTSIIKAMADNEILQIVVFSLFVGTAVAMTDDRSPQIMVMVEQGANIMLKVTELVMGFAPIAIFASLAKIIAEQGLGILLTFAKFMGGFYASLGILWVILLVVGAVFLGSRIFKLLGVIREPILLAFSTASSEAAYPKLLSGLPKIGVSKKIVSFVLPLGYSFNLDGSMMYCTFATIFIAQAHGVHFTMEQKILMLFLLLITSKGIAGVPRASLVVIMATLAYFGLPAEWIALVLGVDQFLDMGRSATNVVGNSVASAVIAKWEGKLEDEEAPEAKA